MKSMLSVHWKILSKCWVCAKKLRAKHESTNCLYTLSSTRLKNRATFDTSFDLKQLMWLFGRLERKPGTLCSVYSVGITVCRPNYIPNLKNEAKILIVFTDRAAWALYKGLHEDSCCLRSLVDNGIRLICQPLVRKDSIRPER
jgi:hypothetical protein